MNLEKLCEQTSNQLMLHSHTSISQTHIHSLIKCAHLSRNRAQSTAFNDFFPSHQFDFLFTLKSKRYTRFSGLILFCCFFFLFAKVANFTCTCAIAAVVYVARRDIERFMKKEKIQVENHSSMSNKVQ